MLSTKPGLTVLPTLFYAAAVKPTDTKMGTIVQDMPLETLKGIEKFRAYQAKMNLHSSMNKSDQSDVD